MQPTTVSPEERFRQYVESTGAYNAAIIAAGDEPWHGGDLDRRRELFMRRYARPAPPAGLGIPEIRGHKPLQINAGPLSPITRVDDTLPIAAAA